MLFRSNNSASTITLKDNGGTQIATITSGSAVYVYLTNNATAAGVWRTVAFGATVSAPDVATIAGYGLAANGATLQASEAVSTISVSTTLDTPHRAKLVVSTGSNAEFVYVYLPTLASINNGYYVGFMNASSDTKGVCTTDGALIYGDRTSSGGSGTIDHVQPNESCWYYCSGTAWYKVGYGQSNIYQFSTTAVDVSAGNTTLLREEYENDFIQLTGTPAAALTTYFPLVITSYYVQNATTKDITLSPPLGGGGT